MVLQARINSLDENFLRILSDNLDYLGNLDVQGKINLYSSGLSKSRNTLAHVGENDLYLMYYTRFLSTGKNETGRERKNSQDNYRLHGGRTT